MSIKPCKIEDMKQEFRKRNFMREFTNPSRCADEARERAWRFWPQYEQINRDFCPEDPVYSVNLASTALSTTADHIGVEAPTNGTTRLLEVIVGGEATAAAVNRFQIARSAAPFGGGVVAIPCLKFNNKSPAGAGVYGRAGIQTLTNTVLLFAFNAFGGFIRWVAPAGAEIYFHNTDIVSLRSVSGTSTITSNFIFEEL